MAITRSSTKEAREYELARKDPNKFVYFKKLPIELRFAIWKLARPGPRFIKLKSDDGGFFSPTAVPTLLHVNKESRDLALESYELSFARPSTASQARIYFDPTIDGLLFQSPTVRRCLCSSHSAIHELADLMAESDKTAMKRLMWEGPTGSQCIYRFLDCNRGDFTQLEEFTLVKTPLHEVVQQRTEMEMVYLAQNTRSMKKEINKGTKVEVLVWL